MTYYLSILTQVHHAEYILLLMVNKKIFANLSAIKAFNANYQTNIEIRQVKYLNNIVEQDHRAIKWIIRGTTGFKAFDSAAITLNGIEMVQMIKKGQIRNEDKSVRNTTEIFYSMAA